MLATRRFPTILSFCVLVALPLAAQDSFVNWETPHVSPLATTPDGSRLLAVNTPDNRLEVFDATRAVPLRLASVPVGLDPVSVRARDDDEVWVVNHLSDSVSVISLSAGAVVATLATDDEPSDVVFAGNPERAFVSCSQANTILVFDPSDLTQPPVRLDVVGEDPRAMARSADGSKVFVAVFESGNRSTVLGGGIDTSLAGANFYPPNVVSDPAGPYAGTNPPPNSGAGFSPPVAAGLPTPPPVGLIVKKDAAGKWLDDNGGDWTDLVSGASADKSGRLPGWDLADHDVAIVDTDTLGLSYATGLMNICMALAVHPASGELTVVGTDGTNEQRFEPELTGRFLRVLLGRASPAGGATLGASDLNPHLDYSVPSLPQPERDRALGDPRGIVWNAAGTRGYVSGMGSNNVVVIDAAGNRVGLSPTIEVGEGPTGLVLDEAAQRLFVLDKFEAAISVVDTSSELEVARIPFHDPSPAAVKLGRRHLYGTHENSGLGHISCASCHVDARVDRLAWDLGDPAGAMKALGPSNKGANIPGLGNGFQAWHPMKGPMTTQTLQDIIGHEPLHWRGDRFGLEEFAPAFQGLQGDDTTLTAQEMQEFEDFLDTITIPPNPYRELDNSLPDTLPLPGHFTTGRFGPAGQPLSDGHPQNGLALYRPPNLLDAGAFACSTCHTMPTGAGTDYRRQGGVYVPIAPGPDGERHHMLVSVDGQTNRSIKVPQLRTQYEKTGFDTTQLVNTAGFGLLHDGSVDSIARFVAEPLFDVASDQEVADLVAFMLCFSGSDLPSGATNTLLEPPGTASQDTHAAVGRQTTLASAASAPASQLALIADLVDLADAGSIGLVAKGLVGGEARGFAYLPSIGAFASDRAAQVVRTQRLLELAGPGKELTLTAVPQGSEVRIGVDRDLDGFFDRDELDAGSDPADADSVPGACAQTVPPAPTALAATLAGATHVDLSWTDNSAGAAGFELERSLAGAAAWQPVATLPAGTTTFSDTAVGCESEYVWRVSATNCAGASGFALAQESTGPCCPAAVSYCVAGANSAGPGAALTSSGSSSVSAADFALHVSGGVPGGKGLFAYAPDQQQTPYGDGFLCIAPGSAGTFRLLPAAAFDAAGNVSLALDFTQPPVGSGDGAIAPGSTWNFQLLYRDPASGANPWNASDALQASFCP